MSKELNTKSFKTLNDLQLIIKNRKSAVIFEVENNQDKGQERFELKFTPESFRELFKYIEAVSSQSWINLNPREADSMGADYYEYYDRKLDNNGYISIKKDLLLIDRPSLESNKLYQFNKRKMESFIYDFKQYL